MNDAAHATPAPELEPISQLLAFLATNPDGNAVAYALDNGMLTTLNPLGEAIYLLNERTAELTTHGTRGILTAGPPQLPLEARTPITDAYTTNTPTLTPLAHAIRTTPLLSSLEAAADTNPEAELTSLPLNYQAQPIGVLTVITEQPLQRTWYEHVILQASANATTLWAAARTPEPHAPQPAPPRTTPREHTPLVTDRQRAILDLIRDGRNNDDIAKELGYSASTIKQDIQAVAKALGATNRKDLITRADLSGL